MLSLDLPTQPYWLDLLPGLRVKVRPLDAAVDEAAKHHAAEKALGLLSSFQDLKRLGQATGTLPDLSDPHIWAGTVYLLMAQCLGRVAILDWQGVGRGGKPAPVTPENIDALMCNPKACRAFLEKLTEPLAALDAEGNASGAAAAGISAAAPITAAPAGRTARAGRKPPPAPNAPTSGNRHARRKAGKSGA